MARIKTTEKESGTISTGQYYTQEAVRFKLYDKDHYSYAALCYNHFYRAHKLYDTKGNETSIAEILGDKNAYWIYGVLSTYTVGNNIIALNKRTDKNKALARRKFATTKKELADLCSISVSALNKAWSILENNQVIKKIRLNVNGEEKKVFVLNPLYCYDAGGKDGHHISLTVIEAFWDTIEPQIHNNHIIKDIEKLSAPNRQEQKIDSPVKEVEKENIEASPVNEKAPNLSNTLQANLPDNEGDTSPTLEEPKAAPAEKIMKLSEAREYIKKNIRIVDFLKGNGEDSIFANMPFLCRLPSHQDNNIGFARIYEADGKNQRYDVYKCSCGCENNNPKGYDIIGVVQEYLGIEDHKEAVDYLAKPLGLKIKNSSITLPDNAGDTKPTEKGLRLMKNAERAKKEAKEAGLDFSKIPVFNSEKSDTATPEAAPASVPPVNKIDFSKLPQISLSNKSKGLKQWLEEKRKKEAEKYKRPPLLDDYLIEWNNEQANKHI